MTQLEYLSLEGNGLKKLPKAIDKLSQLKTLILQANYLVNLPDEIGDLSNLEVLDIVDNDELVALPESIGYLSKLWKLRIDADCNSSLKLLPESFK